MAFVIEQVYRVLEFMHDIATKITEANQLPPEVYKAIMLEQVADIVNHINFNNQNDFVHTYPAMVRGGAASLAAPLQPPAISSPAVAVPVAHSPQHAAPVVYGVAVDTSRPAATPIKQQLCFDFYKHMHGCSASPTTKCAPCSTPSCPRIHYSSMPSSVVFTKENLKALAGRLYASNPPLLEELLGHISKDPKFT